MNRIKNRISQTQVIAGGFLGIILLGTCMLMLPIATRNGLGSSFFDALFTATSASCVTGLVIADTFQHWTVFGQMVILGMIQIGGLGFMTIGVFFSILLHRKISLKERGLLQESVNTLQMGGIVKLVKKIVVGTIMVEGIGAVLLSLRFIPDMGVVRGTYNGVFHSISAFCNAGFDLMGRYGAYGSLTHYYDDWIVNLTIMGLIIIGGIGFIVWDDITRNRLNFRKYMLHTKMVLVTTAALIILGTIFFLLLENHKLFAGMSVQEKLLSAMFSAVTPRTAGFNTVDTGKLSEGSQLLTIVLMFIGGSPGSTAGGIKTTTTMVLLVYVWSNMKHTYGCNLFRRRLDDDAVKKASSVLTINLFLALAAALLICSVQSLRMEDVLFEVFSAIGTVGMSTGITRELNMIPQIAIIFLMYCGRIGSLSFALSFMERKKTASVQLPVGKITIG